MLIAAPFIKAPEAEWVCDVLRSRRPVSQFRIQVLTDIRSESVLNQSLDIEALRILAEASPSTAVVTVPSLHAKVYVADEAVAVVTSANLTTAGLDSNYEYGVALKEQSLVQQIRSDLRAYARVGSLVAPSVLADLALVGEELCAEYRAVQRSASAGIRRRFNRKLRTATIQFLAAQVGTRSANSLFSDAIVYVLSKAPLRTIDLHPRIQRLLPDLCDDSIELIINGQHFGKRWKHAVRNAQQYLKRQGVIRFDRGRWRLTAMVEPGS